MFYLKVGHLASRLKKKKKKYIPYWVLKLKLLKAKMYIFNNKIQHE